VSCPGARKYETGKKYLEKYVEQTIICGVTGFHNLLKFSAYSSLSLNCFLLVNLFCVITLLHASEIYESLKICLEMLLKNTTQHNNIP